jgi:hypothetical protein
MTTPFCCQTPYICSNYTSELEIFQLKPGKDSERFGELVSFLSHVAPCYK